MYVEKWEVIEQPNGKLAIFSPISNVFVAVDGTPQSVRKFFRKQAEEAIDRISNAGIFKAHGRAEDFAAMRDAHLANPREKNDAVIYDAVKSMGSGVVSPPKPAAKAVRSKR